MTEIKHNDAPVALITGAGRRIGAIIARHLHAAGFRVAVHCHHSIMEARALVDSLNALSANSAHVFIADLSSSASCQTLIDETLTWGIRLDLLVNNASIFTPDTKADWEALFNIHVKAPYALSLCAARYLDKTGGSIVNITDIHAEKPLKGYAMYGQSKAALLMQTKALARALAPGVRVNAIAPGAILWPERGNALDDEAKQRIIDKTPLKRHGAPEYVAQAVLFFANHAFITGESLRVDGGRGLS